MASYIPSGSYHSDHQRYSEGGMRVHDQPSRRFQLTNDSEQEPSDREGSRSSLWQPSPGGTPVPTLAALKRPRGSGVDYLMKFLREELVSDSSSSSSTKSLLTGLLSEHGIESDLPTEAYLSQHQPRKKRKPIETSMSDERVMQLAQEGELSFLASLLKVIEEEGGTVTTKFLIKACCLSVEPARVPSLCDAKEMVMAALHLLSRQFRPEGDNFPALPLIRCINGSPDLEKRSYEPCGDWTTRDPAFVDQVLQLEQVFYNTIDYKFLARENMCPTLPSGRDLLLLKGSAPAYCMGKTKKAPPSRRKKGDGAGGTADDGND